MDKKWAKDDKFIEYYGVSIVDGCGGTQACERAKELKELGYDILVLIDSDEPNALKRAEEIKQEGIKVISWDDNVSTEERIFLDMPRKKIQSLIDICIELYTKETIKQWIKEEIKEDTSQYEEIEKYLGEKKARKLLGKVSKERRWFKRIDKGEILGDIIRENYELFDSNKDIIKKLEQVREWAYEG